MADEPSTISHSPFQVPGQRFGRTPISFEKPDDLPDPLVRHQTQPLVVPSACGVEGGEVLLLGPKAFQALAARVKDLREKVQLVKQAEQDAPTLARGVEESAPLSARISAANAALREFDVAHPGLRERIARIRSGNGPWPEWRAKQLLKREVGKTGVNPDDLVREQREATAEWDVSEWGAQVRMSRRFNTVSRLYKLQQEQLAAERVLREAGGKEKLLASLAEVERAHRSQVIGRGVALVCDRSTRMGLGLRTSYMTSVDVMITLGLACTKVEGKATNSVRLTEQLSKDPNVKALAGPALTSDTEAITAE